MRPKDIDQIDEESSALLRRILERQAYRQRMAANIRGHGIKFFPELEEKLAFVTELEASLHLLHQVERLYVGLGGEGLTEKVRPRMERIPYPVSRQEQAICLGLVGRAERSAARCYLGGISRDFAEIARDLASTPSGAVEAEEERFIAFARDSGNRAQALEYWQRWMVVGLRAIGRPGTSGDLRAVELQLRTKSVSEVMADFLMDVSALQAEADLPLPSPSAHGIDMPAELLERFNIQA